MRSDTSYLLAAHAAACSSKRAEPTCCVTAHVLILIYAIRAAEELLGAQLHFELERLQLRCRTFSFWAQSTAIMVAAKQDKSLFQPTLKSKRLNRLQPRQFSPYQLQYNNTRHGVPHQLNNRQWGRRMLQH